MRNRSLSQLSSLLLVWATLTVSALPTQAVFAQVRSLREGLEIEEYSSPFPEWIIRPVRTKAKIATRATSDKAGLDRFERFTRGGTIPDSVDDAPMGYPTGKKKVVIVLADIIAENEDGSTRFIPAPMRSAAEVREFLFGNQTNLHTRLSKVSWKKLILDGDVTGDGDIDVFGPVTLTYKTRQATDSKGPAPEFAGGDLSTMGDLCTELPEFSKYQSMGLFDQSLVPPNLTLTLVAKGAGEYFNCPWYAATYMSTSTITSLLEDSTASDAQKAYNHAALVHEIGHAISLNHSHGPSVRYEGPDDSWKEAASQYGDLTCLMGFGVRFGLEHYNVPQSYRLGWLPRSSAIEITKAGTYTVTLDDPAKGPEATLPTSVWIERRTREGAPAPGFVVVSAGTGGEMVEEITIRQDSLDAPRRLAGIKTVPFGLTVHSVNPSIEGGHWSGEFYDHPEDDGGTYLEGIAKLNKTFKVPHLGITVKLLKREGDKSVVEIVVRDMHRMFTEMVEERVPGTSDALKAIVRVRDGVGISAGEVRRTQKLYRLFKEHLVYHSSHDGFLDTRHDVSSSNYEAGENVDKALNKIKEALRKVLSAKGQRQKDLFQKLLKPAALKYLRLAAGRG